MGSYVNVLSKDILRLHNIQVEYGLPGENVDSVTMGANAQNELAFQLTTQSQSGALKVTTDNSTAVVVMDDTMNASIQEWTNGYLIAVESMFLGIRQGNPLLSQVSIILECTSETMSQAAAMALSLSQQ